MKANEFIFENNEENIKNYYDLPAEDVILGNKLKTYCMDYINEVGIDNIFDDTNNLFRGVTSEHRPVIVKNVRLTNRKTLDTPNDLHTALNSFFTDKFGEPFRNGLFAVNDRRAANEYVNGGAGGYVYIIFPFNDYKFVWSPEINDMWIAFKQVRSLYTDEYDDDLIKWFIEYLDSEGNYTNTNLRAAISSSNEIMFRCDQYIGINFNNPLLASQRRMEGIQEIIKS